MNLFQVTIPIEPKGQMRARAAIFKGKDGKLHAGTHKHKDQDKAESVLLTHLLNAVQRHGIDPEAGPIFPEGPLLLGVKAFKPIPVSWSKRRQAAARAGEIRPVSKPDLDNFVKHLKDVSNGVLWRDDAQVVEYLPGTGKYYDDQPRWEIEVRQCGAGLFE